jgi:D-tyrosyl-tRNA(Tyr) deacylase
MRAVIQRVLRAEVSVAEQSVARIQRGLLVLLGAGRGDSEADAAWMADKIARLRLFEDGGGRMNLSISEAGGEILCVSQFTLFGDCRKGTRPSFTGALEPEAARQLIDLFAAEVRARGVACHTGVFGAHMRVELVNDGPVTLLLDSRVPRRDGSGGFAEDGAGPAETA